MRRAILLLFAVALVASACGGDDDAAGQVRGGDVQAELDALVAAAEDVRGLEFIEPPEIVILTASELADRVRDQIEEDLDPEDVAVTQRLYQILGLLEPSLDLGDAYADLYAENVVGLYDDDTGELLIAGDAELSPLSKTVVVHELVHALTDQHFGFGATFQQMVDEDRFHEASALQALFEGDATYYQLVYMQTLPTSEQVEAVQESLAADSAVLDSLPGWFAEDLTWPYDTGFVFVQRLVEDQDVPGLNQAYTLVPSTTEQIIHPGAYFTFQPPVPVDLPEVVLPGYEAYEEGEWGEWNLELLLLDAIEPGEAVVAATGWGGDAYRIYWDGADVAFAYLYEGDSTADTTELAESLARSVETSMAVGGASVSSEGTAFSGGDDYAAIAVGGRAMLFVAAGDPAIGATLFEALRPAVVAE